MDKPITIEPLPDGSFNVIYGDEETKSLTFGEALDITCRLMLGVEGPPLAWLRTKEQWAAWLDLLEKRRAAKAAESEGAE